MRCQPHWPCVTLHTGWSLALPAPWLHFCTPPLLRRPWLPVVWEPCHNGQMVSAFSSTTVSTVPLGDFAMALHCDRPGTFPKKQTNT